MAAAEIALNSSGVCQTEQSRLRVTIEAPPTTDRICRDESGHASLFERHARYMDPDMRTRMLRFAVATALCSVALMTLRAQEADQPITFRAALDVVTIQASV